MASTIQLRDGYDGGELRTLAKRSREPRQICRLLALPAVYDGMSRADAARVGGMGRQTLRDWAHRFKGEGPEGLRDRPRAGRPRRLSEAQMATLGEIVETGPDLATDGVVRWRRIDLKRVIAAFVEFREEVITRRTVFELDKVDCKGLRRVYDFPGGADRLVEDAEGFRAVVVNGTPIRQNDADVLGASDKLPGQVLRGGQA